MTSTNPRPQTLEHRVTRLEHKVQGLEIHNQLNRAPSMYNQTDLSKAMKLSTKTIQRLIVAGSLQTTEVNGRKMVTHDSVVSYLTATGKLPDGIKDIIDKIEEIRADGVKQAA